MRRPRLVAAIACSALAGLEGCAQLIGAGFDGAQLAGGDDTSTGPTEGQDGGPGPTTPPDAGAPGKDSGGGTHLVPDSSAGVEAGIDAGLEAAAPCEASVGAIACAAFAGNYEIQDPNCQQVSNTTCRHPDPFGNACACPAGSSSSGPMPLLLDCGNNGFLAGELDFCQVNGSSPTGDFAGAFHVACADSSCSTTSCLVPNTYSGGCSCPGSSVGITFVEVSAGGSAAKMTLCYNPSAPAITFAGAYQTEGSSCLVVNPESGDCTCPPGSSEFHVRTLSDPVNLNSTLVSVCIAGQ